jgi:hypothetical protein
MTEFTRNYGLYPLGQTRDPKQQSHSREEVDETGPMLRSKVKPGICIPWEEKRKELLRILGDENLLKKIWEEVESFGYLFIWQVLLSF